jgi:Zn-dependent protease with chaperone function
MGLVVAYENTSEINRALALCQILTNSSNPQVKEWAVRHLTQLTNRYPLAGSESNISGFVAFDTEDRRQETGDRRQNTGVKSQETEYRSQESGEFPTSPASPLPPFPHSPHLPISPSPHLQWRQAGRAKRWQPLSPLNLIPFWLLQFGSATLLFWLIRELLKLAIAFTNALLVKLPYLEPLQIFYNDSTQFVLLTLGILLAVSPWLLDKLLRLFYGLQPLSINTLSTHSPEASRVLQRYCKQQKWSLPQLGILPTSVPVALTYGNLPRTARIIVSQGLLEQLADDEIATIYASQLGHIVHWDFVVMSLVILVTKLLYTVYCQVSQWGDTRANPILRLTAAAIASLAYSVWWLLSSSTIWLSQLQLYYSDRTACEITGNPNALTRALLKIAQGVALDIQQQEHTSWLLESLNLLTPIDYRQAIALSNFQSCTQLEHILAWDCQNPYRYWLSINNTHPLIGDRLQRLNHIALHWHLETELNLFNRQKAEDKSQIPTLFLLQGAPFLGIALGFAFGCLTWLIGAIGILLGIEQLAWMYGDWTIIKGCLPIGFSIGTFIRINSFFPDIKPATMQTKPSLTDLLANPNTLPIHSQPVRLQGKLLGRHGISNCLGQDLVLQSPTGLVKLHHFSWLGPFGNFLSNQLLSPKNLLGQNISATGWFRRSATSWLDIDTLRTQEGKVSHSAHPIWSTLLAITAAAWGAYIILSSG